MTPSSSTPKRRLSALHCEHGSFLNAIAGSQVPAISSTLSQANPRQGCPLWPQKLSASINVC
jgi:hypothetical protein